MTSDLTTFLLVLGPPVGAIAALALRLRWRTRRDVRSQETLRLLASRLPETSIVEIRDQREDGSILEIRTSPAQQNGGGPRER